MAPTNNINNDLTNSINEYVNIIFRNGFIYGFFTGSIVTFILMKK